MIAKRLSALLVVGLPLAYAGCGGDNLTLPSEGEPAAISVVDGNGQTGRVGAELANPLIVRVADIKDRPVAGATVEFSFDDAAAGGTANPTPAVTGADGTASFHITLGTHVGPVTGHVSVPVPAGTAPVQTGFNATARSADASGIAAVSGDGQRGQVGTTLPDLLVVQVSDGFGNPIAGVMVQWSVTGGGSVSESSVETGADGRAAVARTLGNTAGEQRTLATAENLVGSPVIFRDTATAGTATSVVKISGDVGAAPAGSVVQLVVEVRDANSNPIAGAPVTWLVGEGGGSANPRDNNTDGQGRAGTQWTLGSSPGSNTLNVVSSGGATAKFTVTGTGTGSPSNLALSTQPPASVPVGTVLDPAPVVQIQDAAGHDVAIAGVDITVGLAGGAGRVEGTLTQTTDASGRAQFPDLRITGGTGSRRLIFAADGYRSVTSNKFEVTKAATTTTITGDDPDPSTSDQIVTVSFTVTSAGGTPTGRVDVTVSGGNANCHATVAQGSCQIALVTAGARTLTATYNGDDSFATSSGTASHTVNNPPVANDDAYATTSGVSFHVPGASGNSLIFNDTDPDLDDLFTVPTTINPTASGGSVTIASDGSFDYTPPPAPFTGSDTFTYTLTDRPPGTGGLTAIGHVTITITP